MSSGKTYNLFTSLSFVLMVQRIYLISPVKIVKNNLVTSWRLSAYTFTALFFYCALTMSTIILGMGNSDRSSAFILSNGYVWMTIYSIDFILSKISFIFMATHSEFKKKTQIKFFHQIRSIDSTLKNNFQVQLNYSTIRVYNICAVFTFLTFFIFCTIYAYFNLLQTQILSPEFIFIYLFVYQCEQIAASLFAWNYINCVELLRTRFKWIQKLLQLESKMSNNVSSIPVLLQVYKDLIGSIEMINDCTSSVMIIRYAHDFLASVFSSFFLYGMIKEIEYTFLFRIVIFFWMTRNTMKIIVSVLIAHLAINTVCFVLFV